jgi:hypothetical protein
MSQKTIAGDVSIMPGFSCRTSGGRRGEFLRIPGLSMGNFPGVFPAKIPTAATLKCSNAADDPPAYQNSHGQPRDFQPRWIMQVAAKPAGFLRFQVYPDLSLFCELIYSGYPVHCEVLSAATRETGELLVTDVWIAFHQL